MDQDSEAPRLSDRLRERVLSLQCEAYAARQLADDHQSAVLRSTAEVLANIADRLDHRRASE